ncbi:hypothetical protein CRG98_014287 [Punica granatum]|uniref:Uncharacterized protein n=1 Tax=Punica granatum TaxID=22663 RepID=A0A2I0KB05_PUNGR|nr:hypothetical protein CRG98_014287 [Punica granatum]
MGDFGGQVGSTATENHHGSRLRIQFWGETGFVRMRAWHFIMAGLMRRQIGSLANEPGPEPEASLLFVEIGGKRNVSLGEEANLTGPSESPNCVLAQWTALSQPVGPTVR